MRYLQTQGYECVPVNPNARDVLGIRAFGTLEEAVAASGPFDIVDVFRRSELTVPIAEAAVATGCRALWLQLGVSTGGCARRGWHGRRQTAAAIDHQLRGRCGGRGSATSADRAARRRRPSQADGAQSRS
jgi:hypothetical protein